MRRLAMILSLVSLGGLVAAGFAYARGGLTEATTNHLLLAGSLVWLACAPIWMKHTSD